MAMPFAGIIYYYCRGMTNFPLIVGDVQLPTEARLQLHQNIQVTVPPMGFLPLVPRLGNSSGMLFQVTLAAACPYIGFMEGMVRAHIDDGNASGTNTSALPPVMLSSGTEDYFEGANFFDTGLMQSPGAGVTWVSGSNPGPYTMGAYKHHVRDPVVWWDTFELTARNFDYNGYGGDEGAPPPPLVKPAVMSSYAWYYEW
jgi:hypothetical protein